MNHRFYVKYLGQGQLPSLCLVNEKERTHVKCEEITFTAKDEEELKNVFSMYIETFCTLPSSTIIVLVRQDLHRNKDNILQTIVAFKELPKDIEIRGDYYKPLSFEEVIDDIKGCYEF